MMKSQLDMIEADLKVLQSEFKKKNPQIREVRKVKYANLSFLNFRA